MERSDEERKGDIDPNLDYSKSTWETREGMIKEEEVVELGEERGKGDVARVRADQKGQPGEQPGADPVAQADKEGGRRGRLLAEHAREYESEHSGEEATEGDKWQKYDRSS